MCIYENPDELVYLVSLSFGKKEIPPSKSYSKSSEGFTLERIHLSEKAITQSIYVKVYFKDKQ